MLPRFVQLGEYNLNKFTFCQIIEKVKTKLQKFIKKFK